MYDQIIQLYNSAFIAEIKNAFSPAVLTNIGFLPAAYFGLKRYNKGNESISNTLTISVVSFVFLLSAFEMEYAMRQIESFQHIGGTQNILILYAAQNTLAIIVLWLIHERNCHDIGPLFLHTAVIQTVFSIMHIAIWLKVVWLKFETEFIESHMVYSIISLYLTGAVQLSCLFPKLIKTKLRYFINPLALIGR